VSYAVGKVQGLPLALSIMSDMSGQPGQVQDVCILANMLQ
jgi:hypothetical protein